MKNRQFNEKTPFLMGIPSQIQFQPIGMNEQNLKLLSIVYSQQIVIKKLLENQSILKLRMEQAVRSETTDTQGNNQFNINGSEESPQFYEKKRKLANTIILPFSRIASMAGQPRTHNPKKRIEIISTLQCQKSKNDQILSDKESDQDDEETKKRCETKNIIKNYGKAILTFIKKHNSLTQKILEQFEIDSDQFHKQLQRFRCKVNSITDLKLFWTQKGNRFDKVFRILSNIYLKKHSLKHTFCSRVRNYSIHIKYRKRLLQILQAPQEFSSIKYF